MEQHQIPHARFLRQTNACEPTRVAPAFAVAGQLFRPELRIIHQHIGACGKLAQAAVELRHARLVVGGINNRAGRRLETIAQAALRVVQQASVTRVSPTLRQSPPAISVNSRAADIALRFTGKYGDAICASKTRFRLPAPRNSEQKL